MTKVPTKKKRPMTTKQPTIAQLSNKKEKSTQLEKLTIQVKQQTKKAHSQKMENSKNLP